MIKKKIIKLFCKIFVKLGILRFLKWTNRRKIRILMFHSVSDRPTVMPDSLGLRISKKNFEKMIVYLKRNYNIVTLADMHKNIQNKVILTFDDGYLDNYTSAFPILKKYSVPAIIYLIKNKMHLSKAQIQEMMKNKITFGSHTLNHVNLTKLIDEECDKELKESRKAFGHTLNSVAYPYGLCNRKVKHIAKKYYTYGLSGDLGLTKGNDRMALKRIFITNSSNFNRFKCEVEGILSFLKNLF